MSQAPREEDVAETFIIYADHSGSMPADALGTGLRALGWNPSEVEIQEYITLADSNGTGKIPYAAFVAVVNEHQKKPKDTMKDIQRAFAVFDKEGKGHIRTDELKHMMTKIGEALTEDEVDEMIRKLDSDRSGTIDVHEFASMM